MNKSKRIISLSVGFALIFLLVFSMIVYAADRDQLKKQDKIQDRFKDGSCLLDLAADRDQLKKQDKIQDRFKDGTCLL